MNKTNKVQQAPGARFVLFKYLVPGVVNKLSQVYEDIFKVQLDFNQFDDAANVQVSCSKLT